jgi:hypothetical protein
MAWICANQERLRDPSLERFFSRCTLPVARELRTYLSNLFSILANSANGQQRRTWMTARRIRAIGPSNLSTPAEVLLRNSTIVACQHVARGPPISPVIVDLRNIDRWNGMAKHARVVRVHLQDQTVLLFSLLNGHPLGARADCFCICVMPVAFAFFRTLFRFAPRALGVGTLRRFAPAPQPMRRRPGAR